MVGAGGIGLEVGRLCAALGMRVVGTRRREQPGALPQGFSEVGGADAIDRFLPESDFVVICCQWTPETTGLFNKDRPVDAVDQQREPLMALLRACRPPSGGGVAQKQAEGRGRPLA